MPQDVVNRYRSSETRRRSNRSSTDNATNSDQLHDAVEVVGVVRLIRIDECEVISSKLRYVAYYRVQAVQGGTKTKIDLLGCSDLLPVAASEFSVFITYIKGNKFSI